MTMRDPNYGQSRVVTPALAGENYRLAACTGKERFEGPNRAARAVKRMRRQAHKDVHTYRCQHCAGWHIGGAGP